MKRFDIFVILGSMVIILCCITSSTYALLENLRPDYVPGEIIISFDPDITESDVGRLANEFGFSVIRKLRLQQHNKYLVKIGDNGTVSDLIDQLAQNDDVLRAKRNALFHVPETWGCFPEIVFPVEGGDQLEFEYLEDVEFTREDLFWQWYRKPEDITELICVSVSPSGEMERYDGMWNDLGIIGLEGEITFVNRAALEFPSFLERFPFDFVFSVGELSSMNTVPEPATLLLLGLGGLALRRRR